MRIELTICASLGPQVTIARTVSTCEPCKDTKLAYCGLAILRVLIVVSLVGVCMTLLWKESHMRWPHHEH